MSRNLAITSADGQTGHLVAELVLTEPFRTKIASLVCLAFDTEACSDLADLGAIVLPHPRKDVVKSLTESLKKSSVDTIFVIPPAKESKLALTKQMVEATKAAQVKNVVLLSAAAVEFATQEEHPYLAEFLEIESLVLPSKGETETDAGHSPVIIRAGFYAENILLYAAHTQRTQRLSIPLGSTQKFAPVALGDISQIAAHVLTSEGQQGLGDLVRGQLIIMTGPMLTSGTELASAASQALGTEIEYEDISEKDAKSILSQTTLDPSEQHLLLEYYSLVRAGKTNYVSTLAFHAVVGAAEGKLGRQVMPMEPVEFFKTYGGEFKGKRRKTK